MKDPFPFEPLPWLSKATEPLADLLNLPTLPLHIHEVLAAALLYSVVFWPISPIISTLAVGDRYRQMPRKRRINWDAHVVSMVQCIIINALSLWVILADEERAAMDAEGRIWGYTGACAMVQALAAGYFLWDLVTTSLHLDVFGPGTLAHAIAALIVYSFGFRPFVNYYAPIFILWELSTPFLNVHWFFDKLGMTGTRAQLYNGLLLISTFFFCRLVYGTYQSYLVFRDIWNVIGLQPSASALNGSTKTPGAFPIEDVMSFLTPATVVPIWLGAAYLASNLVLNFLNFYWFVMMIKAVKKRFVPASDGQPKKLEQEAVAPASVSAKIGGNDAELLEAVYHPRRRKA